MTVQTVPFSKLVATDAINARTATKDGLDELAASIAAKGLIQPLAVRPADGGDKFEVIDGRRRYAAIAKLVKAKTLKKDHDVPVLIRNEDDTEALETSLMANTVRLPMHPVDQHAVFARLAEHGKSDADIAARFGIGEKTVRQHKALGRLSPVILDAWKKGKIDAEVAKAFTSHRDHDVQASAYERLKKQGPYALSDHSVRRDLTGSTRVPVSSRDAVFVGLDVYLAAGGTITESLFEDDNYIDDAALLKKLARDKLEAECAALKADGWIWVASADDLPNQWPGAWTGWDNVKGEDWENPEVYRAADFTPEERARSGVALMISYEGELEIEAGLVRPDGVSDENGDDVDDDFDGGAPDADDDESPGEDTDVAPGAQDTGRGISGALLKEITTAQTNAVALIVKENFELVLRIALAALRSHDWGSPAKITVTSQAHGVFKKTDFDKAWARASTMSYADVMATFADVMAEAMSLVEVPNIQSNEKGRTALIASLPSDKYLRWMREAFNGPDYFKRSDKATALSAIEDMREAGCASGIAPEDVLASMKKAELADAAANAAQACGWLPEELRHPDYALTASVSEAAE